MGIYAFEGRKPKIHESAYVSSSSEIIGDVTIGKESFIGSGACIKGDYGSIIIGDYSNVQENCVIHARPDETTMIGDWVTIGHAAVIHGANIKDWAVIGMGSVVADHSLVGPWAVIAEGAVVVNGTKIPEESISVGIPAKPKGKVNEEFKERWIRIKEEYRSLSKRYKENLEPL
ncbi:MAG: gamma carbonic anhydrase family protein [Thermoplasmata archaeon]